MTNLYVDKDKTSINDLFVLLESLSENLYVLVDSPEIEKLIQLYTERTSCCSWIKPSVTVDAITEFVFSHYPIGFCTSYAEFPKRYDIVINY